MKGRYQRLTRSFAQGFQVRQIPLPAGGALIGYQFLAAEKWDAQFTDRVGRTPRPGIAEFDSGDLAVSVRSFIRLSAGVNWMPSHPPSTQRDEGPDGFDQAEGPGPLKESVGRCQRA